MAEPPRPAGPAAPDPLALPLWQARRLATLLAALGDPPLDLPELASLIVVAAQDPATVANLATVIRRARGTDTPRPTRPPPTSPAPIAAALLAAAAVAAATGLLAAAILTSVVMVTEWGWPSLALWALPVLVFLAARAAAGCAR